MRQLLGNIGFRILVADIFPIQRKIVLPETVVIDRKRIPFGEEVLPMECRVEIGKTVRCIGQSYFVVHVLLLGSARPASLVVAGVDAIPCTPDVEPAGERVTQRDIVSLGTDVPVVFVNAVLSRTMLAQAALDIIFCITVNQTDIRIDAVLTELAAVIKVEVEGIALFGL